MAQLIGVVLTGGSGARMGRTKGDIELGGVTLAQHAAGRLWPLVGSVLISVAPGATNPAPDHPAVEDRPPAARGPLAGIQAAFRATGRSDLLVLACDYPWIPAEVLKGLVSACGPSDDVVLATDGAGRDHPLVAIWSRRAEDRVDDALAERHYKVRALLAELEVRRLGTADFPGVDLDRGLLNVNHPEDLLAI